MWRLVLVRNSTGFFFYFEGFGGVEMIGELTLALRELRFSLPCVLCLGWLGFIFI